MISNSKSEQSVSESVVKGDIREPKRRILDAALKTFIDKGFDGARTREIAEAADVNVAMVHYYFGSKAKLYRRVVQPLFMILAGLLRLALSSSEDPKEQVEALVDAYFDFLSEYPELPRLMMWELASSGKNLQAVFTPLLQQENVRLPNRLIEIFKSGQESGVFGTFPPEQAAISFVGLCVFPFLARPVIDTIFQESLMDNDFVEERREHVKSLILRGLPGLSWLHYLH